VLREIGLSAEQIQALKDRGIVGQTGRTAHDPHPLQRGRDARRLPDRAEFIPTDAKVALVDALSDCGYAKIEVTSFTSPKAIRCCATPRR
jgi:hypothetical protein